MTGRIDLRYQALIDAVRAKIQTKISGTECAPGALAQIDLTFATSVSCSRRQIVCGVHPAHNLFLE